MKKITSKNLPDRLARYGALSLAVAGISNASGQIVHTDINPDEVLAPSGEYIFDLDGDGVDDFSLNIFNAAGGAGAVIFTGTASAVNSNGLVGAASGNYTYPSNLSSGTVIDGNSPIVNSARGDLNFYSCAYPGSNFCNGVTDGYIGLQFMVSGNTHYGWVRIDLSADAASMTIKDYAFNSTPNEAIEAGQTVLSTNDQTIVGFNHFYNATTKQLTLSANEAFSSISLYNLLGQEVIAKDLSSNNEVVDMSAVKDGVYVGTVNVNGQVATFKIIKR